MPDRTPQPVDGFTGKPRIVILSDIGNEPDDQMSFVRLLVYSNEFDLEAMIATTSCWLRSGTHAETMHALINTYGEVRNNLLLHASGWPTASDLNQHVFVGQSGYGMASIGAGKSTEGSNALANAIKRPDSRPLWISVWGGANTLAQALIDLRASHTPEEMDEMVSRLRVMSTSDQDDAGPWLRREFPKLFYIAMPSTPDSSNYYLATWTGISGDRFYRNGEGADTDIVTNEWLDKNVRSKGPLGKAYPKSLFIMEGDTPDFLNLIDNGLNGYRRPDWGGWGGRYVYIEPYGETHKMWSQGGDEVGRANSQDTVVGVDGRTHVSDQASIWRWREAFQNDFAARMDWTIEDFAHANHNPLVTVNGQGGTAPIEMEVNTGETLKLDATGTSDPDPGQKLTYSWFVYPEAGLSGAQGADVVIEDSNQPIASVEVRSPCRMGWPIPGFTFPCRSAGVAHIILAVTDDGSPRLTSYRRVILTVKPAAAHTSQN